MPWIDASAVPGTDERKRKEIQEVIVFIRTRETRGGKNVFRKTENILARKKIRYSPDGSCNGGGSPDLVDPRHRAHSFAFFAGGTRVRMKAVTSAISRSLKTPPQGGICGERPSAPPPSLMIRWIWVSDKVPMRIGSV